MMTRLSPLILVLIAFWLGRESSADKSDETAVQAKGRFGIVESDLLRAKFLFVEKMIVVKAEKGKKSACIRLANGTIFVGGDGEGESSVEIAPQFIEIGGDQGDQLRLENSKILLRDSSSTTGDYTKGRFVVEPIPREKDPNPNPK